MKERQLALQEISHSWGGLSYLADALLWEHYGYWSDTTHAPDWYDKYLALAKEVAKIVKESQCKFSVEGNQEGVDYIGMFRLWDEANPWVEPWEVGFCYHTAKGAQGDYETRAREMIVLHSGVIKALLHYAQTGEAIAPDWYPPGERFWEHKKYNREKHMEKLR